MADQERYGGGWLPPAARREPPPHVYEPPPPAVEDPPPPSAPPPDRGEQSWLRRALWPIGVALFAVFKWGKALILLLPKVKVLSTAGSALVSVAAYAIFWGWRFAAIFVVLLFVHEMGHALQAKREGLKVSAPVFIPFLGAAILMKDQPRDAVVEARIALAGPIVGALGAAALLPIYWATGSHLWLNLAYVGFFLNLFNLIPVTPLDGGRAMAALTPWMWFVGLFILALLVFTLHNPILILFLIIGAFDVYGRWKRRKDPDAQAYYRVSPRARAAIGAAFLVLIVALGLGMDLTYRERDL